MRPILIPPMVAELVSSACTGIAGTSFHSIPVCPACHGRVQVHDTIQRRFSRILLDSKEHDIYVSVRRFCCKGCGRYLTSPAPFYERTRFGSPIVDLCRTIAQNHSSSQTAGILMQMGIVLDRGTVRNLVNRDYPLVDAQQFIGFSIPLSIIRLSELVLLHKLPTPVPGDEVLAACGWEPPGKTRSRFYS